MTTSAVEAVIFDWGGTLTPWHPVDLRDMWLAYATAYELARADELADALLAGEGRAWHAARHHHASGTLDEIFRHAGVEPAGEQHNRALAAYHAAWDPHTYLDPDVPALFDGLHERGIKVGVLSNTLWSRAHHEEVFARDGILDAIDGAVYSSEIEWTKPHPEAFRAAMDAVGLADPAAGVYVGDRLFEDVWGPHQIGLRAVHVPHSAIPDNQRGHSEDEPDAVVQRLSDLLAVIDGWNARPPS